MVDQPRGKMTAIVDAERDRILGWAILGIKGREIIGMLRISLTGNLRCAVLQDAILAHPTLAASLNKLFGMFEE